MTNEKKGWLFWGPYWRMSYRGRFLYDLWMTPIVSAILAGFVWWWFRPAEFTDIGSSVCSSWWGCRQQSTITAAGKPRFEMQSTYRNQILRPIATLDRLVEIRGDLHR